MDESQDNNLSDDSSDEPYDDNSSDGDESYDNNSSGFEFDIHDDISDIISNLSEGKNKIIT